METEKGKRKGKRGKINKINKKVFKYKSRLAQNRRKQKERGVAMVGKYKRNGR